MKGSSEVVLTFFDNSDSREYTVIPDVVEYDKHKMALLVYDLSIGWNAMKALGIILDL